MIRASFSKVTKAYSGGRSIFTDLSFELKAGARCALLGPNGAGKSTLMRLLTGALKPEAGEVSVGGLAPWRHPERVRATLGFLPEGAPLWGDLTVREHLRLAGRLRGLAAGELTAETERLTTALALARFHHRPAAALSQGQKRRTALASALLGQPDFLLLDEPAGGLDPEESFRLLNLLKALPSSTTLLLSGHNLSDLYELTGEIMLLAGGRLAARGPWAEAAPPGEIDEAALFLAYRLALAGGGAKR
jgi:ABC-2 type transport system ATP-binding protein